MSFFGRHRRRTVAVGPPAVVLQHAAEFHDDSHMTWNNPADSADLQTATVSIWFRRHEFNDGYLFSVGTGSSFPQDDTVLYMNTGNELQAFVRNGGSLDLNLITNGALDGLYDDQDWHHVVWQLDLGNTSGTASDKSTLYVDGVEPALRVANYPGNDSAEFRINRTDDHYLSQMQQTGVIDDEFRGLMADVNIIDGAVVAPTEFGQFDGPDWVWKDYTGTHGPNGRRFQFLDETNLGQDTSL